jgi:hypothetical protein
MSDPFHWLGLDLDAEERAHATALAPKSAAPAPKARKAKSGKDFIEKLGVEADSGDDYEEEDDAESEREEVADALDEALAKWEDVLRWASDTMRLLGKPVAREERRRPAGLLTQAPRSVALPEGPGGHAWPLAFGIGPDAISKAHLASGSALVPSVPFVRQEAWLGQAVPMKLKRLLACDEYGSAEIGEHLLSGSDLLLRDIENVAMSVISVARQKIQQAKYAIAAHTRSQRSSSSASALAESLLDSAETFGDIVTFYAAGPVYAAQAAVIARAKKTDVYKSHALSAESARVEKDIAKKNAAAQIRALVDEGDAELVESKKAEFVKLYSSNGEKRTAQVKWLRRLLRPASKAYLQEPGIEEQVEAYSAAHGIVGGGIAEHDDPDPACAWARKNEKLWLERAGIDEGKFVANKDALRELLGKRIDPGMTKEEYDDALKEGTRLHSRAMSEKEHRAALKIMRELTIVDKADRKALKRYLAQKADELAAVQRIERKAEHESAREEAAGAGAPSLNDYDSKQRRELVADEARAVTSEMTSEGNMANATSLQGSFDRIGGSWESLVGELTGARVAKTKRTRLRRVVDVEKARIRKEDERVHEEYTAAYLQDAQARGDRARSKEDRAARRRDENEAHEKMVKDERIPYEQAREVWRHMSDAGRSGRIALSKAGPRDGKRKLRELEAEMTLNKRRKEDERAERMHNRRGGE